MLFFNNDFVFYIVSATIIVCIVVGISVILKEYKKSCIKKCMIEIKEFLKLIDYNQESLNVLGINATIKQFETISKQLLAIHESNNDAYDNFRIGFFKSLTANLKELNVRIIIVKGLNAIELAIKRLSSCKFDIFLNDLERHKMLLLDLDKHFTEKELTRQLQWVIFLQDKLLDYYQNKEE